MKKRILTAIVAIVIALSLLPLSMFAANDANNGNWSAKTVTLRNTSEAELMVRVGDIDALNDGSSVEDSGYNPFTAANQFSHAYPWAKDNTDPAGTDRIFIGSKWKGEACDGYGGNYLNYKSGADSENAYGNGALEISFDFDASGINVKNALLQLCIDDFQALTFESKYSVKINGKDAPFIAELMNQVDQTGPTAYVISAIIPSSFYTDISSGKVKVTVDETTGVGDGFAIDFAKLLVNYNSDVFKGTFTGTTEPGATVRLLGTSTTVKASSTGGFEFEAVPGLNAVRASKDGYVEKYSFGIVFAKGVKLGDGDEKWTPEMPLTKGKGNADIDFSQFGVTAAWENASSWAKNELSEADKLGLIPDSLKGADLTKPITRAEFAAVSVKAYEALTNTRATPVANNPFTDTSDAEVLKALNVGVTNGVSATKFEPATLLNREQAATMLTRVYKKVALSGWTLETDGNFNAAFKALFTAPKAFADDKNISAWAKDSVYFMSSKGIINGVGNNTFAPRATTSAEQAAGYAQATREQALIIATRMVTNLG